MLKDALGCVRIDVDKVDEIRERGIKALELLSKVVPYFREQYDTCQNGDEKPDEPAEENSVPDTENLQPGADTAIAQGLILFFFLGKTFTYHMSYSRGIKEAAR